MLSVAMAAATVSAAAALCSAESDNTRRDATRFKQDRFAIGFWVDPAAGELNQERYAEIADAGFTLVLGGFGARARDGGDSDTLACITGAIAEAFYGDIGDAIVTEVMDRLTPGLRSVTEAFCTRYCSPRRL